MVVQVGTFFPILAQAQPAAAAVRSAPVSGPLPAALGTMAPGARISGVILALDSQGKQQLRTRQGIITLSPRSPLPAGARVLVEMGGTQARPEMKLISLEQAPPAAGKAPLPASAGGANAAPSALSHHWPGLEKLVTALAAENVAKSAAATNLPRPGPGLANSLLAFIAALRSGQIEQLFGPSIAQKITDNPRLAPLAGSVRNDMALLQQFAFDTGPGAWYGLFAPLIVGDQLRQLRLFIRREEELAAGGREPITRRFIIETEMKTMGPIQIDGLLGNRNLDLLLRSTKPLPGAWQTELGAIVTKMAALFGKLGGIGFQTCQRFPVAPLEEGLLGPEARGVSA